MTLILFGLLALAVIFLIFSVVKKVVKLAVIVAALLLLVGGIWHLARLIEVPDPILQSGPEATEENQQGSRQGHGQGD